jgi:hypothetical protein
MEIKVVLPEGCSDIELISPYPIFEETRNKRLHAYLTIKDD